jgi:predicted lipoprotein with Yx(FWY)xxD motif
MTEEEPMRTSLVARIGAVAVAGVLLAACGSLGSGGSGGGAADDYATDNGADAGAGGGDSKAGDGYGTGGGYGEESGGGAEATGALKMADSDFGQILTDSEGRALYAFTKDTAGKSTCYSSCEENWPPLVADGKPTASGDVDASLLKTVSREDGTKQAMIGKWPLYYFAGDSSPGDTQGQGVNGVWWLVDASGKLVKS